MAISTWDWIEGLRNHDLGSERATRSTAQGKQGEQGGCLRRTGGGEERMAESGEGPRQSHDRNQNDEEWEEGSLLCCIRPVRCRSRAACRGGCWTGLAWAALVTLFLSSLCPCDGGMIGTPPCLRSRTEILHICEAIFANVLPRRRSFFVLLPLFFSAQDHPPNHHQC
jgi:hypothetical protein